MFSLERLPRMLFDPRGRADRVDMLIAAGIVVVVEAGLALSGLEDNLFAWLAKGCALWIGIAVSAKRLHDLGYSAWWLAAGAAGLCMWSAFLAFGFLIFLGPAELEQGSFGLAALFGLIMLPAVGIGLWLHLAEGETLANRFGPAAAPAATDEAMAGKPQEA